MSKFYTCSRCNSRIPANTSKKLLFCKCGTIGIDGTFTNSRIVGDKSCCILSEDNETFIYRIKNIKTGLYFKPYTRGCRATFNEVGKFYTRKPSLSWVSHNKNCIIEKYVVKVV